MKYEDIQRANNTLKSVDLKGKDYVEVNQRVKAFRMLYPTGSIKTKIEKLEDGVVVISAMCGYWEGDNFITLATGTAYERENSTFINKTSYIENCETSAVGRCLGFVGLGIDTSIASAEEVGNAMRQQSNEVPLASIDQKKEVIRLCQSRDINVKEVLAQIGITRQGQLMTLKQYEDALEIIGGK